jgi:hypothetical protein
MEMWKLSIVIDTKCPFGLVHWLEIARLIFVMIIEAYLIIMYKHYFYLLL